MLIRWEGLRRSSSSSSSEVMSGPPQRSGRPSRTAVPAAVSALLLLCLCADVGSASPGDQSAEYKSCLRRCRGANCTLERQEAFRANQPWYLALLRWDCADECRHDCMWQAVDRLQANGSPVPQFHGKWPFWRFYGIQEPASVVFSILNGVFHVWMWRKFRKVVPPSAPHYIIWKGQAVLSINAWFWSAVFHARDTPLTEKLDYYCAFSVVLYSLYSLCMRVLGTQNTWLSVSVTMPFAAFFVYHIQYLNFVHFDYGYNMKANVITGLLNSLGWLGWCWLQRRRGYVWRGVLVVVVLDALLLLELGDFPPWRFLVDAHALWHLGTAPLPLLWYRFLRLRTYPSSHIIFLGRLALSLAAVMLLPYVTYVTYATACTANNGGTEDSTKDGMQRDTKEGHKQDAKDGAKQDEKDGAKQAKDFVKQDAKKGEKQGGKGDAKHAEKQGERQRPKHSGGKYGPKPFESSPKPVESSPKQVAKQSPKPVEASPKPGAKQSQKSVEASPKLGAKQSPKPGGKHSPRLCLKYSPKPGATHSPKSGATK